MIQLRNIYLSYKEELIHNGTITIQDNKITCLTGLSGSGKTSLLYLIGLLNTHSNLDYYFNNTKLNFKDKKSLANIRRLDIGYVFQDNNILEHFTIKENFSYIAQLCNIDISDDNIKHLLSIVQLEKSLDTLPSHLSGGEKQRLAIALALSKDPKLIVLDEPTSSLDKETSTQIMDVLHTIAHQHHKMILIASHSKLISQKSDMVYRIENKQILPDVSNNFNLDLIKQSKRNSIPLKFYWHYIFLHLKKQRSLYSLLFLIVSFIISFCSISQSFSQEYMNYLTTKINQAEIEKIVVATNQEPYASCFYQENTATLDPQMIQKILDQHPSIESYMYYKDWLIQDWILDGKQMNKEAVIVPYKHKKELNNKLYQSYSTNKEAGVYISYSLIPDSQIQYHTVEFSIEDTSFTLPIQGISTAYDTNDVSLHQNTPIIYVPYEMIESLLTRSSTCIFYTYDKENITTIISDIKSLDKSIGASNDYMGQTIMYQEAIDKINTFMTFLSITLYILTIISIALIYFKQIVERTYEIALLKANGMSNGSVSKLILLETIIHLVCILCISCTFIILCQWILSLLLHYSFTFIHINTFLSLCGLSLFAMFVPVLITLFIILKNDPAKTLRN